MLKIFIYLFFITSLITASNAESKSSKDTEHQYNFYVGNFDFSDDKQAAVLFGFQHQNETLERETFYWKYFSNYWCLYNRKFCSIYLFWN